MDNNSSNIEEKLIKYNNSVVRATKKVAFANFKLKCDGFLHNAKYKLLTPFCGKNSYEFTTAEQNYDYYKNNFLERLAGRKNVARLSLKVVEDADKKTEIMVLMQNELPILITRTTRIFEDPDFISQYRELVTTSYRGVYTTKAKKFQYFDIRVDDSALLYFDKSVSDLANFICYKGISSTKRLLGKKRFIKNYANQSSSDRVYFTPNKDRSCEVYKAESLQGGKIFNAQKELTTTFNECLVSPVDRSIISTIESSLANELESNFVKPAQSPTLAEILESIN